MITSQENFFLHHEANKYFERNSIKPNKFILNALKLIKPNPKDHIIEIGCSNGATLDKIRSVYRAKVFGLDPSSKAIRYAKEKYKLKNVFSNTFLNFKISNKFDIVIDGGFLYVTPNSVIKKTIKKIIDIMKENSYFVFWDYDTPFDYVNTWKHHKRLKSYKRNYLKLFNKLNNKLYLVNKKQFILEKGTEIKHYNQKINFDKVITTMIFKKIS